MKNNTIITNLIIPLLFLSLGSIHLQAQFPTIGPEHLSPFIEHLECEYEDQISIDSKLIGQFMNNIWGAQVSTDCFTPTVSMIKETSSTNTFSWPAVAGANGYTAGMIGLETGVVQINSTSLTQVTFNTTVNQLYLFAFISDCLQEQSMAEIIIVEKDIVSYNGKYDSRYGDCMCSRESIPKPLKAQTYCPYFDTHFFAWNNSCFANKYRFTISDQGDYHSEFYTIVEEFLEVPKVYALKYCNPNPGNKYLNDFGDGTNYQAVITGEGIHFYFLNDNLINPIVEGHICDCWLSNDAKSKYKREGFVEVPLQEELQISPNPFQEELQLVFSADDGPAEVLLYNLSGQLVKRESHPTHGLTTLHISTNELAAGLYHLQVRQGQRAWQQKVVKAK